MDSSGLCNSYSANIGDSCKIDTSADVGWCWRYRSISALVILAVLKTFQGLMRAEWLKLTYMRNGNTCEIKTYMLRIGPPFLFLLYFLFTYMSCDHHVITSVTIVQVTYCPCDVHCSFDPLSRWHHCPCVLCNNPHFSFYFTLLSLTHSLSCDHHVVTLWLDVLVMAIVLSCLLFCDPLSRVTLLSLWHLLFLWLYCSLLL